MAAKKTAPVATKKVTPKRVNPQYKLTGPQIDVLGVLHENDRWHDLATIATDTGIPEKEVVKILKNLTDREYLLAKEDGTAWRYTGLRCKALKLVAGALRLAGEPLTAGLIGAAVWSDPKVKDDPKADTRYAPAAYAVLKTAFDLGVVFKIESDSAPLFGVVA